MYVTWVLRTTSLLVLVLGSVVCQNQTSSRIVNAISELQKVVTTASRIEEIKREILNKLNMTSRLSPPRLLTPREHESSRAKVTKPPDNAPRKPDVAMVLSESDHDHHDVMRFRLDSRLQAHVQDISAAYLIVSMRTYRDMLQLWDKVLSPNSNDTGTHKRRKHDQLYSRDAGVVFKEPNQTLKTLIADWMTSRNITARPLESSTQMGVSADNIELNQASSVELDKRSLRDLKSPRVKVVVKAVEPETGRKRRIAVERMRVTRKSAMAIPLSRDLLMKAAASSNHTLVLQLACKRCKGRVHIEKVYKKRRNQKHRIKKRLNPNRPYLFIQTGSQTTNSGDKTSLDQPLISKSTQSKQERPSVLRSKRESWSDSSSRVISTSFSPNEIIPDPSSDTILMDAATDELLKVGPCCFQHLSLDMHELSLQRVIFPRTLSFNVCFFYCPENKMDLLNNSTSHRPYFKRDGIYEDSKPIQKPRHEKRSKTTRNKETNWPDPVGSRLHSSCLEVVRLRNSKCVHTTVPPQSFVYLDESNTLTTQNIDTIIFETCDCNGVERVSIPNRT